MTNVSLTGIWYCSLHYAPTSERQARPLWPSSGSWCSRQSMNNPLKEGGGTGQNVIHGLYIITPIPARNQAGVLSLFIQLNRYTGRHSAADDITAADDLSLQHRQQKALPAPPCRAEVDPLFALPLHPAWSHGLLRLPRCWFSHTD